MKFAFIVTGSIIIMSFGQGGEVKVLLSYYILWLQSKGRFHGSSDFNQEAKCIWFEWYLAKMSCVIYTFWFDIFCLFYFNLNIFILALKVHPNIEN